MKGPGPEVEVRTRPLALAVGACIGTIVLTGLLLPGDPGVWYGSLARPEPLLPEFLQAALGVAYYPAMGLLLYRSQVHLAGPAGRVATALLLVILLGQAGWNPLLLRLESLTAGVAATATLVGAMAGVLVLVLPRDRTSVLVLAPYLALALHDLWWASALLRLNGG